MIFRSLCAFIWFKNIEKMLLQMTSGFLQLESTIHIILKGKHNNGAPKIIIVVFQVTRKNLFNMFCDLGGHQRRFKI
jgi:hypothetical protein